MTTQLTYTRPHSVIRLCGQICVAAGVLGAASGIYLAFVPPAVAEDSWSYPQSPDAFAWTQAWLAVQHIGLILGLLGLWWSGAVRFSRLGRLGHYGAVGGMVGLTLTELAAVSARYDSMDTTRVGVLGAAYGVVTLLVGAALIAEGVEVVKAGQLDGWRRWTPLALGVWVFVPMLPALATSSIGARLAIAGWMLLFVALGLAILQLARRSGHQTSQTASAQG